MPADEPDALESFVGGDLYATEQEQPSEALTARSRISPRPVGETYLIPGLGDRIGRYVSLRVLGRGGMGIVIAAHDPELDRQVAIKLVHPQVWRLASVEARELLRQEARAMARLVHPNVITVHDLGTVGDQLFVAMELVAGHALDTWLVARPRRWSDVLAVCREAGRGIAAAHRAGLIHRDVKPSNVLIDEHGHPRIADFGLAMLTRPGERATPGDGSPAGTPAYMSPEQHKAAGVTAASDQFSFCVMVFEALYGERPFEGRSAAAIAEEIELGRIKAAPARNRVPVSVRRALVRGLARDPDARFPTMDALLAALEPRPVGKWIAGGLVVLAAAGAGAAAMMVAGHESPAAAAQQAAASRAAAVWSAAAQRDVRAGLVQGGAAYTAATGDRVVAGLDRYVAGWIATRIDVARAARAGEQAAAALEWRMACLDRRLDDVRALVSALAAGGDGVAARAVDGVGALTPPRVCVERELSAMRAPPEEPARRARYRELLRVLADTNALIKVGRFQDAAARSSRLLADARALADPPLLAEATLLDGSALASSGQADQAVARFREVVLAAAAAGEPRIEARAWCDLITLSINSGRGRPAADVIMAAEAAVARVGGDPDTDLAFAQAQAMVAIADGRPADAEKLWRRAQALAAAALPADHPRQSQTRMGIATALAEQHRFPEALVMLDEARTTAERTYGPDHPNLAQFWGNRAVILFELARHEESLAAAQRSAAIAAPGTLYAGLGPMYQASALIALGRPSEGATSFQAAIASFRASGNHIQEYQALLNLALFQYNEGDAAAGPTLDEALVVGRRSYGDRGGALMYPLTVRGVIDLENERFADGLERCQQAVDLGLAAFGPEDSSLAMSLLCVSRAHRRLGAPAAGQEPAERAMVLADRGFNPSDQVEARLELARVLMEAHGDRGRARRLVEDVLTRETDPENAAVIRTKFQALLR